MPNIEVRNLSKNYGAVKALQNVSLRVRDGEYLVLLGPSGCGKTTLLKIIAGIYKPTFGKVIVDRKDITALPPEERNIGFVFQNYALFPHMSVIENAMYGLIARGDTVEHARRKAIEMLKIVHLETRLDALPKELSGGMQQRLSVARALATGSRIVFLDEPTNALDANIRKELRHELRKMVKRLKLTAIHVTHDQEEAMTLADRIVIMKNGRVIQVGSPAEVYDNPNCPFVANFLGEANFLRADFSNGTAELLGVKIRNSLQGEKIACIRPEHMHFDSKGSPVTIVSKQKMGPYYRYEVDYEGMIILVRSHKEIKKTHIKFSPEHVLFFDVPEEGLRKSLQIE